MKFSSLIKAKKRGFNDCNKGISICPFKNEELQSYWSKGFDIAWKLNKRNQKLKEKEKGILVRVVAQYEENYAFYEGGQGWKPKGGQEFEVRVPFDFLMYAKEAVEETIKAFLKNESNQAVRYSLIEFEPIFSEPHNFNQDSFEKLLNQNVDKQFARENERVNS